ncbi:MAG TPA: hypothetical protein VKP11_02120 [Frankiaceae bacterium]|nr:hypothetical protein [Frankiaceae bacterium]
MQRPGGEFAEVVLPAPPPPRVVLTPVQPDHPVDDGRPGGLAGWIGRAIGGFFLARTGDGQQARVGARRGGGEERERA